MKIGIDYWQVLSHYPEFFKEFVNAMSGWDIQAMQENRIYIVSAVGKNRVGTIKAEVMKLGFTDRMPVHEVVFEHPRESPELKLAKCRELGITVFFDDRDDVCRLLTAHGILAMRVGRRDNSTYDLGAERE